MADADVQYLTDIISGDSCSFARLVKYMERAKFTIPQWMTNYRIANIVEIKDTQTTVNMFDVSINTEEHGFVSSGIYSHNSWRMPVFGIGSTDKLTWQSIDVSGRDAEFQYLSDNNARVILSAFQMSPEELPGYAHLARGTNSQSLSEQNNEWKLTAARDVGLRPLLYDVQDFLNTHILPKLDKEISDEYQLVLAGLEQEDPEKESTRLQQDAPLHMTYNQMLDKVEKPKLPMQMGGDMPLNPQFQQQVLDPYLSVGQVMEFFFGVKDAAKDPRFAYYRDPAWLQYQQIVMQKTQMMMQAQMMQQQAAMGAQQGDEGDGSSEAPPQDEQTPQGASETEKTEIAANNLRKREEWHAANYQLLEKSTNNNQNRINKMIIARHERLVDRMMEQWSKESQVALKKIKDTIKLKKGE